MVKEQQTKNVGVSMNLRKAKKKKLTDKLLSKGSRKIKKIFVDKKTGKEHIKYESDNKGVVYIEHVPHGFYEEEIKDFFNQFGEVTAVNLPRNKNDRSKGYAFVQFKLPEVAKIAAETMNNYLMCNRLIKTKYIPPEQQKSYLFRKAESAKLRNRTEKNLAEMRKRQDAKIKIKRLDNKDQRKFNHKMKLKIKQLTSRFSTLGMGFECQVAGGAEKGAAKLISVKKLDGSTSNRTEAIALKKYNKLQKSIDLLEVIFKNMSKELARYIAKKEKLANDIMNLSIEAGKSGDQKSVEKILQKHGKLNKRLKILKSVFDKVHGNVKKPVSKKNKSLKKLGGTSKENKGFKRDKKVMPSMTTDDVEGVQVVKTRPKRQTKESLFLKKVKKLHSTIKLLKKIKARMTGNSNIQNSESKKEVSSLNFLKISTQTEKNITPKSKNKKETSV